MSIASFLIQFIGSSGYAKKWDEELVSLGDTADKFLDAYGNKFSEELSNVVLDSMSRYISGKISGKKNNENVSILMFAKSTVNLKKFFSRKWYAKDLFFGYPWQKRHYLY